jgi:thioredoxin-like negative regulator of GroEL
VRTLQSAWAHFERSEENLGDHFNHKIDVDKNQQVASQYQVRGVPMILFQNGKQLWRQSGVVEKGDIIKVVWKKVINDKALSHLSCYCC